MRPCLYSNRPCADPRRFIPDGVRALIVALDHAEVVRIFNEERYDCKSDDFLCGVFYTALQLHSEGKEGVAAFLQACGDMWRGLCMGCGHSLYHMTARAKRYDILAAMFQLDLVAEDVSVFHAIRDNDDILLRIIMLYKPELATETNGGEYPLWYAYSTGRHDAFRIMVAAGCTRMHENDHINATYRAIVNLATGAESAMH